VSRTWKDRPTWVRSQDHKHEELFPVHCHGDGSGRWMALRHGLDPDVCDIGEPMHDRDDKKLCGYRTLDILHWYDKDPSWWVREMAEKPDRARRRAAMTRAVEQANTAEDAEDLWDIDDGIRQTRVPYYW